MIKLDLSKFKHVKTADGKTELKHDAGHSLILHHDVLPPEHQAQLKALAGEATDAETPDQKQEQASPYGKVIMKAKGGSIPKKLAEGGDPLPDPSTAQAAPNMTQNPDAQAPVAPTPASAPQPQISPELAAKRSLYNQLIKDQTGENVEDSDLVFRPDGKGPGQFDPNLWKQAETRFQQSQTDKQANDTQLAAQNQQTDQARAAAGLPPVAPQQPAPASPQPSGDPGQDLSQKLTQDSAAASNAKSMDPGNMLMTGYQNQLQGINAQAKAQGDLGDQQAAILQQRAEYDKQAMDAYETQFHALNEERLKAIEDVKAGMVNPEAYWQGDKNGNGGHSKVAAGIGMILAGFNPTPGARNSAVDMVNHQLDRSIDAQKANLGAKESLLSHNLQQFGNLRDATQMTRIMSTDMLSHQLEQAAAKAQSPMAKAAALQASGQLKMQAAGQFRQFTMMRMIGQLAESANGPQQPGHNPTGAVEAAMPMMAMYAPEAAKYYGPKIIPGVGIAKTDVPEAVKSDLVNAKQINDMLNESLKFSAEHGTVYSKLAPSERAKADTIYGQLIGSIKQQQHDGVYKKSEAEFLGDQLGSSPASMMANITSVPHIKELQKLKQMEYQRQLEGLGIRNAAPLPQYQAANPKAQALQWAKSNPKDPRAAKILKALGQ